MPESVRLIAPSPNVLTERLLGAPGGTGSLTTTGLTEPSNSPDRLWTLSQQGTEALASQTSSGSPLIIHLW